jgi:hypothetical protein
LSRALGPVFGFCAGGRGLLVVLLPLCCKVEHMIEHHVKKKEEKGKE